MEKRDAVVAVLREDDRFLVIRRGPKVISSGYWCPLSGRVEPGETQEEALAREVREEVGLDVTPLAKVWECDAEDIDLRLHWWTARVDGGVLEPDPGEVSEARWVTVEEFFRLEPTYEGDREFFRRVLPSLG